jgi:hypothetical protein
VSATDRGRRVCRRRALEESFVRLGDRCPVPGSKEIQQKATDHSYAEVTLRPEGEGTHIRWSATWDRTIPGRIVHRRLRSIYPDVVHRLIAAADRKVPARPAVTRAAGDGRCGPPGRRGLA